MTLGLALLAALELSDLVTARAAARHVTVPPLVATYIEASVQEAANRFTLPESLVLAVIEHESAYNRRAVSSVGCMGLMQLNRPTMREVGRWLHIPRPNAFRVQDNILIGVAYLAWLRDRYHGNMAEALTAFNMGPGRFERRGRHVSRYARIVLRKWIQIDLELDFNHIPSIH